MSEGHWYGTYEMPFWRLVKYLLTCVLIGLIFGWILRFTTADYVLAVWLWQVFILTYWYVTLPAVSFMIIVAYMFRSKHK